ncbi:MAG TPA: hypothetical protein PLU35_09590 [Phycisphaerales bacterium]|nr:hypothetical protein [Phycisphaerales bacterium]
MALLRTEHVRWTLVRRCRRCGHDGPEVQGDHAGAVFECPACGEDLYARPAMSYAEMEGFIAAKAPAKPDRVGVGWRTLRRVVAVIRRMLRRE